MLDNGMRAYEENGIGLFSPDKTLALLNIILILIYLVGVYCSCSYICVNCDVNPTYASSNWCNND